jgi:hypothetical protein
MKIEFLPSSQEVADFVPPPMPAGQYLPDWYKKAKSGRSNPEFLEEGRMNVSFKACMPFLDSLKMGYIQETWCDLYIDARVSEGKFSYSFSTSPDLISVRSNNGVHVPAELTVSFAGYAPVEVVWHMPWIPKTPKGWSVLVTTPLSRLDLPFHVTSGVIDSDSFYHSPFGQVPFYPHRDFCGVIPAGTPMYQIIPFKRENWRSSTAIFDSSVLNKREYQIGRKFTGLYKELFWKGKRYD